MPAKTEVDFLRKMFVMVVQIFDIFLLHKLLWFDAVHVIYSEEKKQLSKLPISKVYRKEAC